MTVTANTIRPRPPEAASPLDPVRFGCNTALKKHNEARQLSP
jgi:hypothetical protein